MATNREIVLFTNQAVDGTGTAVDVEADHPTHEQNFHLALSGDLGGGSFGLEVSFDNGVSYIPQLLNGETFIQTVLGYDKIISVFDTPRKLRGVLTGSTSASLTAKLYHKM